MKYFNRILLITFLSLAFWSCNDDVGDPYVPQIDQENSFKYNGTYFATTTHQIVYVQGFIDGNNDIHWVYYYRGLDFDSPGENYILNDMVIFFEDLQPLNDYLDNGPNDLEAGDTYNVINIFFKALDIESNYVLPFNEDNSALFSDASITFNTFDKDYDAEVFKLNLNYQFKILETGQVVNGTASGDFQTNY